MNQVLNVPFVGRVLSREEAPEAETAEISPLPVGSIVTVIAAIAVWVALGAGVLTTLGELGPLLTSIGAR